MTDAVQEIRPFRLWSGVLLAPVAWVLAEMLGYYLASRACDAGGGIHALGPSHPRFVVIALAVLCAAAGAVGIAFSVSNLRRVASTQDGHRTRFLAMAATTASVIFVVGMLVFAVPAAVLDVCSHVRW
ncbi:MAG: hypothetical protein M3Y64_08590 [Gemmatimonadota bacterium]|nr:hypothetical protein [Gemmatimonadota bacterium]